MFREAGMSKQPMGILASSPELMSAAKGYKDGGIKVPFYGNLKPKGKFNTSLGLGGQKDELKTLQKQQEEITNENLQLVPNSIRPSVVDNSLETIVAPGDKINNGNESILKNDGLEYPNIRSMGGRGEANEFVEPPASTATGESTVGDLYGENVSANILAEQTNITNAYTKLSNNLADVNDMTFLGTTANKALQEQITLLRQDDKEFTIADAKKAFAKLGYKDDEALTEDFNEEREASFWLNMMKAGASMAAGTSSDTLQNFAKGFTTGLEGFGKDTGQLRKELREDKKEASKTIFNLLKDGKSERIATKALDLQKAAAISSIVSTQAGEEKTRLTNEVNNEVANRKLTISLYKTFADMNFEAKKFNVGREDVVAASNIAYAKMIPDDLKLLIASGEVEIIDNSRPDLLAPDNIKASPKGIKSIQLLLSNLKSGKITDTQVAIGTAGSVGKTNSGIVFDTDSEDYNPNVSGTAIKEYNKQRSDLINSIGAENKQIAQQDVQFAKVNGGKIDLNLQTDKMLSIFTDQSKGQSFVDRNQNIFIPLKST